MISSSIKKNCKKKLKYAILQFGYHRGVIHYCPQKSQRSHSSLSRWSWWCHSSWSCVQRHAVPWETHWFAALASFNKLPAATPPIVYHILSKMARHNASSRFHGCSREKQLASAAADFLELSCQRANALGKTFYLVLVDAQVLADARGTLHRALINDAERGLIQGIEESRLLV